MSLQHVLQTSWYKKGWYPSMDDFEISPSREVASGKCGGHCGTCGPTTGEDSANGILLAFLPELGEQDTPMFFI